MSEQDRNQLEILDEETCWELLDSTPVGRLAHCQRGRPRIVPVNHAVHEGQLVIASRPGSKLQHALELPGAPVAYEVDGIDPESHTGWSVVVDGMMHAVTNRVRETELDRKLDPAWIDTFRDRHWLILRPAVLSGRRLTAESRP